MPVAARVLGLFSLIALMGADWPQFRGSEGTGVATGNPPIKWTRDSITWSTPLPGPGSSSPIVAKNRVFVTCYKGYAVTAANPGSVEKLVRVLICLERSTGKLLWSAETPAAQPEDSYRGFLTEHGYASSTPVTDGESVFVFYGKSGILAYDLEGKKLWQTSVGTESDPRRWGSCSSPILYKNFVIVNASCEGRAVVALNKKTGKVEWKAEGDRLSLSFSTPALVPTPERTYLVVAMPGEAWGLNPDTGKLAWYCTINPSGNVCPAIIPGNGIAYITGGFQARGTLAIKVNGFDDITKTNVVWTSRTSSYVPTPVLSRDRLYCVNEDGIAICLNAKDGSQVYQERLAVRGGGNGSRPYYASPVLAGDHLYIQSRRAGVFVLKAGDQFEQLQQNPALDDSDFNATPAIADNQIFLRSNSAIYCIEAKK